LTPGKRNLPVSVQDISSRPLS